MKKLDIWDLMLIAFVVGAVAALWQVHAIAGWLGAAAACALGAAVCWIGSARAEAWNASGERGRHDG